MEIIVSVENDTDVTNEVQGEVNIRTTEDIHVQSDVTVGEKLLPDRTCSEDTRNVETSVNNSGLLRGKTLRHKYLHTVCVGLALMASGWRMSLVGPTFPDLRLILNESLSRASWIISAIALGGLVGSLLGGTLYDRTNKYAVSVTILLILSVASVATPWCDSFGTMVAIHVLNGACAWGIDTIFNADVVLVWREKSGPFLQAANFAYSLGAMIAPITAEPFFAERSLANVTRYYNTSQLALTTTYAIVTEASYVDPTSLVDDIMLNTTSPTGLCSIPAKGTNDTSNTVAGKSNTTYNNKEGTRANMAYGDTKLHFAFLNVGLMSLIPCCLLMVEYCCLGSVHTFQRNTRLAKVSKQQYPLSKKWRTMFVIILASTLSTYCTNERLFYSFLMTFLMERLQWDTGSSATAITVFWIAFTLGRLLSVFAVRRLKLPYVFVVFLTVLFMGECVMLAAVNLDYSVLVWVSCGLHGLGMSALFASIVSWISVRVCPFTGTVSSLAFCIVIVGAIVYPVVVGNAMSGASYDWFIFLEIILTSFMIFMLTFAEMVYRYLIKLQTVQN